VWIKPRGPCGGCLRERKRWWTAIAQTSKREDQDSQKERRREKKKKKSLQLELATTTKVKKTGEELLTDGKENRGNALRGARGKRTGREE